MGLLQFTVDDGWGGGAGGAGGGGGVLQKFLTVEPNYVKLTFMRLAEIGHAINARGERISDGGYFSCQ